MEKDWVFHHVAVIVKDMDKAVAYYQTLCIGTFKPEFMLDSTKFTEYKVYGQTAASIDKLRMRMLEIGPFILEFVQPLEGDPIHNEFARDYGEGLHHVAYLVDDLEAETARLGEKDIPVITRVYSGPEGAGFAYLDLRPNGGNMLIELIQRRNDN